MAAENGTWRWSPTARLDLYAVGLSTLCMLHCIALPLFVSLAPVLALAAESELVHWLLVVAAVPVSLRVIWKTRPAHGNRLFIAAASVGLALLLLAAFVEAGSAVRRADHRCRRRTPGLGASLALGADMQRGWRPQPPHRTR